MHCGRSHQPWVVDTSLTAHSTVFAFIHFILCNVYFGIYKERRTACMHLGVKGPSWDRVFVYQVFEFSEAMQQFSWNNLLCIFCMNFYFSGGDFLDFYSALYFLRTTRRHGQGSDCQIGSSPTARLARRRLRFNSPATVKCRGLRKIGSCGLRSERETARHCLLTADLRRK